MIADVTDPRSFARLDEEEAARWAVAVHESSHAVAAVEGGDGELAITSIRSRIIKPFLFGSVDEVGSLSADADPREIAHLSTKQLHGLQVCAPAGGLGDLRFRTEYLGWASGRASSFVDAHTSYDESLIEHYVKHGRDPLSASQAESRAEAVLDRRWDDVLELAERVVEHGGNLGGGLFDRAEVKV